jgi:hypothetical protein
MRDISVLVKSRKRKIYVKSDKKEKSFLGMPVCFDSSNNEEEGQERQGVAGVAIASLSLVQASTSSTKSSSTSSSQLQNLQLITQENHNCIYLNREFINEQTIRF